MVIGKTGDKDYYNRRKDKDLVKIEKNLGPKNECNKEEELYDKRNEKHIHQKRL